MAIMAEPRQIPNWREAACLDEDPELFFPITNNGPPPKRTDSPIARQIRAAKAVCGACAIAKECLRYALATEQDFGIWGGLTQYDRRALKRQAERGRAA